MRIDKTSSAQNTKQVCRNFREEKGCSADTCHETVAADRREKKKILTTILEFRTRKKNKSCFRVPFQKKRLIKEMKKRRKIWDWIERKIWKLTPSHDKHRSRKSTKITCKRAESATCLSGIDGEKWKDRIFFSLQPSWLPAASITKIIKCQKGILVISCWWPLLSSPTTYTHTSRCAPVNCGF